MSTTKRQVQTLSAHSSSRIQAFDPAQVEYFVSPQDLENDFAEERSPDILPDYVTLQLNTLLRDLRLMILNPYSSTGARFRGSTDVVFCVVEIRALGNAEYALVITDMQTRPCFMKQGIPTIIMYQVLYLALLRGDVTKVVVSNCVPTSALILQRKLGDLVRLTKNINSMPDCVISDLGRVGAEVSAERLGIAHKLASEDFGELVLREDAFPTAEQLNDAEWVERQ